MYSDEQEAEPRRNSVIKAVSWENSQCNTITVVAKFWRPALYPIKEENQRCTRAQETNSSWPDWALLEQLILLKTVECESKVSGKMTVYTRLRLQWSVTDQRFSLWNIWEMERLPSNPEQWNWVRWGGIQSNALH